MGIGGDNPGLAVSLNFSHSLHWRSRRWGHRKISAAYLP